jgi:hypothetical protein
MSMKPGMKPYHAALAFLLVLLLGWAAVGHAAGRGDHGGGFRQGAGPGFHGGGFHGHPGFPGHPGFHGRAFIGVAPFVWGPGYIYTPPPVVEAPPAYWYYCPSAQAYYPNVPSCAEPWVPVPAS